MCDAGHQVTFTTKDVVLETLHDCNADVTNENGRGSCRAEALALNSCRRHQRFYQSSASFQPEKGWGTTGAGQALPTASASIAGEDPQFCRPRFTTRSSEEQHGSSCIVHRTGILKALPTWHHYLGPCNACEAWCRPRAQGGNLVYVNTMSEQAWAPEAWCPG